MENGELLRRDPPKPDESFLGYIIRLTEKNGHDFPWWILSKAGIKDRSNKYPFLFAEDFDVKPLSKLIGVASEELKNLTYPSAGGNEPLTHIAFGSIVSRRMIRMHHARVCPACIAESGYAHRIWELAPVTACPHHGRLLLETCPACKRQISWTRKTLASCSCGYRWRDTDCRSVGTVELRLTRLIYERCGIPMSQVSASESQGENPLHTLDLQSLIQALSSVARKITAGAPTGRSFPFALDVESMQDTLSKAFDVFESWPDNFSNFLDNLQTRCKELRTATGLQRSFGLFYSQLFHGRFSSPEYNFMREAFDGYLAAHWSDGQINLKHKNTLPISFAKGKYIAKSEVAREFNIASEHVDVLLEKKFLKGIVKKLDQRSLFLIERASFEDLLERKNNNLTREQAGKMLNVSKTLLAIFVAQGLLSRTTNPFREAFQAFDKRNIEELLKNIAVRVSGTETNSRSSMIDFHEAVRTLGFSRISGGEFVHEILNGNIQPYAGGTGVGLSQFIFNRDEISQYRRTLLRKKRGMFLCLSDAANVLDMSEQSVRALAGMGFLSTIKHKSAGHPGLAKLIANEEIEDFKNKYISGKEVALKYGTCTYSLSRLLSAKGVLPAVERKDHRSILYIYRRSDLETLDVRAIVATTPTNRLRKRKRQTRLLNSEKAAGILAVSEESLRRLVRGSEITAWLPKGHKMGRGVPLRFSRFDVERYKRRRMDERDLVSAREAARLLNEDLSWFNKKWVRTGRLSRVEFEDKLGKHFFRRSDVKAMVELKKSTVSGSEAAKILGMHRTAVLKLTKKGMLKPVSGPDVEGFGCNLYLRADVEKLREERKSYASCV